MQLALFFVSPYDQSNSENELVNLPLGLIGASPRLLILVIAQVWQAYKSFLLSW
jgi:hypothetical protein